MRDEIDDLFDVLDEARDILTYEEREGIADALAGGVGVGVAPLTPRAGEVLDRLRARLGEIENSRGPKESVYWTGVAREYITEPRESQKPEEMSDDELEREIERRRKYGLGSNG